MSVRQQGTITKIEGSKLFVSICRPDACDACKAQSACSSLGGGKELILEDDGLGRSVGDDITLKISRTQGAAAVLIAYLVPVILIIGLLLGLQELGLSEGLSAGIVLGVVVLYYIILRIFRRKIETELTIEIE